TRTLRQWCQAPSSAAPLRQRIRFCSQLHLSISQLCPQLPLLTIVLQFSKSKLPFKPSRMSAAATSANSLDCRLPRSPAAAASTASGGGSSGVGQDGIAGQFLRDQLPTGLHLQRQQRRDAMGKPLLNLDGSQHSLRDVQLGVDATSPAASPLPVEAQVHNRTESGVSFDAPRRRIFDTISLISISRISSHSQLCFRCPI
uniref:Uncharacterized protein n=1 Tax=Macrostomum lignano TaxID=282301 RepID=A0A1I8FQ53_9PLAT